MVSLLLVLSGSIKYIGNVLTVIVLAMVVLFLVAAIVVRPDLGAIWAGMFKPSIPSRVQMTAIALIGTTMTPYCIYLHSDSHASEKLEKPNVDVENALIFNLFMKTKSSLIGVKWYIFISKIGQMNPEAAGQPSIPLHRSWGFPGARLSVPSMT